MLEFLAASSSMRGYSSLTDDSNPSALHMRREFSASTSSGIAENGKSSATGSLDGLKAPGRESNILFGDGLPSDCTSRDVGELFRPFVGFKDIGVIHKVARHKGDKAMVLCFVEFDNLKCAYTVMEALEGTTVIQRSTDYVVTMLLVESSTLSLNQP